MSKESPKTSFYKYTEFLTGPDFNENLNVPGFSVRYNQPFFNHAKFRHHFRSDFLNVLLIMKGEISFSLNLEKYTARKDSLIIVSPYTIKKVEKLSKDLHVSGVNFTIDFLTAMGMPKIDIELQDYFSSQYSPCWKLKREDAAKLELLMKQLNERVSSINERVYGRELLYHTFYIFLYELYDMSKKYAAHFSHHISRKENLVKNYKLLLQKQFRMNRNVQAYADQLNITPKYLTETVKEITGKTAGELIDSYVMLEAKLLLDDPLLSIAQISDELNFSDQSFFGKFFKRHMGISPKEYRLSS